MRDELVPLDEELSQIQDILDKSLNVDVEFYKGLIKDKKRIETIDISICRTIIAIDHEISNSKNSITSEIPQNEVFILFFFDLRANNVNNYILHQKLKLCCVCLSKKKDIFFGPCEHCCCCEECSTTIQEMEEDPQCPVCRTNIEWTSHVFI